MSRMGMANRQWEEERKGPTSLACSREHGRGAAAAVVVQVVHYCQPGRAGRERRQAEERDRWGAHQKVRGGDMHQHKATLIAGKIKQNQPSACASTCAAMQPCVHAEAHRRAGRGARPPPSHQSLADAVTGLHTSAG